MIFKKKRRHYHELRKKWVKKHKLLKENLWKKHKVSIDWITHNTQGLAVGSLGGLMLLTAPKVPALPKPHIAEAKNQQFIDLDKNTFFLADLNRALPDNVRELTPEEEKIIGDILSREFGIKTAAELDGKRLNRSYGYIGQEQHLYRFPGDTLEGHMENEDDWKFSYDKGIAPGLGAYGYFAPSGGLLSEKDKMRERYYIAVQTFLAPGFQNDFKGYVDFFRFRKMLVVNPDNGKAVIADIGDAGPAEWTGKSLGGSPEVMHYLQRYDGAQKGPVLYFFIDDPEDKIPLGPINIKGV